MIISHRYKFIFIKTRKTAGTSIEIALSKLCDEKDVVTELGEKEEIKERFGYTGARNFRVPAMQWTVSDIMKLPLRGTPVFTSHCPAVYVRDRVPRRVWEEYYTFVFERNPYDRIVSQYFWNTRHTHESIHEYIERAAEYRLSNWKMYTDGDEIIVDHVARFENLSEELDAISCKLGLPAPIDLARAKTEYRPRENTQEILDEKICSTIADVCAREIARFGYSRPMS